MILAAVILYLIVVALAFAFQTRMVFPGAPPEPALPRNAERLTIEAPDGVSLRGMLLPAPTPAAGAPVILAFPGNATNAATAALLTHDLYPQADVIGFHYRGYPPSTGRTGAAALCADSLLEYDLAARRFPGRPIVAIGFSVGSGVASFVASRRPVAGLILVTPFDSMVNVAAGQMPWLPVRLLFRNPMNSAEWLRQRRLPVAVIAAGSDRLVRPPRTAALRQAIPNLVYDRTISGADHNSIYVHPDFPAAMRAALAAVAPRP